MYVDEKFKDAKPEETVERIKKILEKLEIEVSERWHDSGVENCYSLSLSAKGGIPKSNGKGITKELARASAYGEFIERLQDGLFIHKYQSIIRNPGLKLQAYASDAKYISVEELEETGDWMDHIVGAYNHPSITRKSIANYCKIVSCEENGKILVLPFYSLFEQKYVDIPIDFIDQIYGTNGCCAGNTREEAWVHALSEIMERHANLMMLTKGGAVPKFSKEKLYQYPVVRKILEQIEALGNYDIEIFDYSFGSGFPIVSTRLIDKKTHSYRVNVAADPVFEIALQRSLTELLQGVNLKNITMKHSGRVLKKVEDLSIIANITNQLETGSGFHTADYFANELTCRDHPAEFPDNSNKNNRQLLWDVLEIFKKNNKQIYVRNFSYLGFPSYRFVIPGYSEALILKLCEPIPEFSIADEASKILRAPAKATNDELNVMLMHSRMLQPIISRYHSFGKPAGVPIRGHLNGFLMNVTRAYAYFRLNSYENAMNQTINAIRATEDEETVDYLKCIHKYLELKKAGIENEKIESILHKFFVKEVAEKLFSNLKSGKTPYDTFLLDCDYEACGNCKFNSDCCYESIKKMIQATGAIYHTYINGQDESEFILKP